MPTALARLSPAASPPVPRMDALSAEAIPAGAAPEFEAVLDLLTAAAPPPAPAEESPAAEPEAPVPDTADEERPAGAEPQEATSQPAWPEAALALGGMLPGTQPDPARPAEKAVMDSAQVPAPGRMRAQDAAPSEARAPAGATAAPAMLADPALPGPDLPARDRLSPSQAPVREEQAGRPIPPMAEPPPAVPTEAASRDPGRGASEQPPPRPASTPSELRRSRPGVADASRALAEDGPELRAPAPADPPAARPAFAGNAPDRALPVNPPEAAGPDQGGKGGQAGAPTAPDRPAMPEPARASRESADPRPAEIAAEPAVPAPATSAPAPTPEANSRPLAKAEAAVPHPPNAPPSDRPAADAIVRMREGQVEVVLNPAELGRVTLLLGAEGDPGHLGLYVERPETADLIRRHGDQLLRELRENGMPEARLDLLRQDGQGQHRGGGFRQDPRASAGAPEGARAGPADRPAPPASPLSRLDIRL